MNIQLTAGCDKSPRHPADHRSLRRPSRRARLVRHDHLPAGADGVDALLGRLRAVEGVDVALSAADACVRFALPPDRPSRNFDIFDVALNRVAA